MLAKDQVINTYRALNNWRSFRLKLFIEGIITVSYTHLTLPTILLV